MAKLTIVDPHIHFWDLATGLYPNLDAAARDPDNGMSAIAHTYLANDLIGDAGEIEIAKVVHVEAIPTDGVAEARHVSGMMAGNRILAGIVAHADLRARDVQGKLEELHEINGVHGIRQILNLHDNPTFTYGDIDFMENADWRAGLGLLGQFGMSFDMQLYPHQMVQAVEIVRATPNVMFILNHAGMFVDRTPDGLHEWRAGIAALAACDNARVKISGLCSFDHDWTVESIRPYVFDVLEQFGLDRSMFASNFPVDKRFGTYEAVWRAFDNVTDGFSKSEKSALFHDNAQRIYRL